MACTQIQEEREGKKRKKSHFRPNHYTRVIHIGKGLKKNTRVSRTSCQKLAEQLTGVLNTPTTF
jgi:hypothetical protein